VSLLGKIIPKKKNIKKETENIRIILNSDQKISQTRSFFVKDSKFKDSINPL